MFKHNGIRRILTGAAALASTVAGVAAANGTPLPQEVPGMPSAASALPTAGAGWVANVRPDGALELLSPTGARTPLRSVTSTWDLNDVSADGHRFAFVDQRTRDAFVYDAATRRTTTVARSVLDIRFTRPSGQAVIVRRDLGSEASIERHALDGRLQLVLQRGPIRVAGVLPATDGRTYVAFEGSSFTIRDNATARVLERVAAPGRNCRPERWFTPDRLELSCTATPEWFGTRNLYLHSLSTGTTAKVSNAPAGTNGFVRLWWTPQGSVMQQDVITGACPARFGWRTDQGTLNAFTPLGNGIQSLDTVVGGRMFLKVTESCTAGPGWVAGYDVATKRMPFSAPTRDFALIDPLR